MAVFRAQRFSTYIITDRERNADTAPASPTPNVTAAPAASAVSPKTDDISVTGFAALLFLSAVFMGAAMITSRKRRNL